MAVTLNTIRIGRHAYVVEPVAESDADLIPARFVLHHPRGRKYLLVPDTHRPERLVAIAPMTNFSRFQRTPFRGAWFTVEGGRLMIAPPDA